MPGARERRCEHCGEPVRENAWVCPKCGMVYQDDFEKNSRYYRFAGIVILAGGVVLGYLGGWRFAPLCVVGAVVYLYGRWQG